MFVFKSKQVGRQSELYLGAGNLLVKVRARVAAGLWYDLGVV